MNVLPRVQRALHDLTSSARTLRSMLSRHELLALRYEGTLAGAGVLPISMLFVEAEQYANEFSYYLAGDRAQPIEPTELVLRGSLRDCHHARARLEQEAKRADIVIRHWLLAASRADEGLSHYPMLEGTLTVEADLEAQISRVHSAAHRHRLRAALKCDSYGLVVSAGERAFAEFYDTMYEPYVRGRFGNAANVKKRPQLLELFRSKQGRVLQVTQAGKPIASALLVPLGDGVLSYDSNGFGSDARSADTLAQHTAALELAIFRYAIDYGYRRIAFGYARARFAEGLFTHKRRVGCSFVPAEYSPLVRVEIKPEKRPAVFSAFPLLARHEGHFVTHVGLDASEPVKTVHEWHSRLKNYLIPDLRRIALHTNVAAKSPARVAYETALRDVAGSSIEIVAIPYDGTAS